MPELEKGLFVMRDKTEDFMFQLTKEEVAIVKSQIVTSPDSNYYSGQQHSLRIHSIHCSEHAHIRQVQFKKTLFFVSKILKVNNDYRKWIEEIGHKFRKSQIKAASRVNVEMLKFYYELRI